MQSTIDSTCNAPTEDRRVEAAKEYDAFHQRVAKRAPQKTTIYMGGLYECEGTTPTSGNTVVCDTHRYKIYGGGKLVAVVTKDNFNQGPTRYVHSDRLGSSSIITDEQGNQVESRDFEPFGAPSATLDFNQTGIRSGFTGHDHDDDLGLINMRGRLYDPISSRFITADPFVSRPLDPQGFNRYSYVQNNPLNAVDPSGFQYEEGGSANSGGSGSTGGGGGQGATGGGQSAAAAASASASASAGAAAAAGQGSSGGNGQGGCNCGIAGQPNGSSGKPADATSSGFWVPAPSTGGGYDSRSGEYNVCVTERWYEPPSTGSRSGQSGSGGAPAGSASGAAEQSHGGSSSSSGGALSNTDSHPVSANGPGNSWQPMRNGSSSGGFTGGSNGPGYNGANSDGQPLPFGRGNSWLLQQAGTWAALGLAGRVVGAISGALGLGARIAAAQGEAIVTPYAVEVQSISAEAQAALSEVQSGATIFRTGQLGKSMAGESQYWSLQNPLSPGYAGQMGVPGVTPNFIMGGTLSPGAAMITNGATGLGANLGGGIQVVTSPGGVGGLWFYMP